MRECILNSHCPPRKIEGSTSPDEGLVEFLFPLSNVSIYQWLHLLHVGKTILYRLL